MIRVIVILTVVVSSCFAQTKYYQVIDPKTRKFFYGRALPDSTKGLVILDCNNNIQGPFQSTDVKIRQLPKDPCHAQQVVLTGIQLSKLTNAVPLTTNFIAYKNPETGTLVVSGALNASTIDGAAFSNVFGADVAHKARSHQLYVTYELEPNNAKAKLFELGEQSIEKRTEASISPQLKMIPELR